MLVKIGHPRRLDKWIRTCKSIKRPNGFQHKEDGNDSRKSAVAGLSVRSILSTHTNSTTTMWFSNVAEAVDARTSQCTFYSVIKCWNISAGWVNK